MAGKMVSEGRSSTRISSSLITSAGFPRSKNCLSSILRVFRRRDRINSLKLLKEIGMTLSSTEFAEL